MLLSLSISFCPAAMLLALWKPFCHVATVTKFNLQCCNIYEIHSALLLTLPDSVCHAATFMKFILLYQIQSVMLLSLWNSVCHAATIIKFSLPCCYHYQIQFDMLLTFQISFCHAATVTKWAPAWDFQQFDILTSVDSDKTLQPPFKLRNSKWCSVSSLIIIEYSSD